jgi:hypothetical protein
MDIRFQQPVGDIQTVVRFEYVRVLYPLSYGLPDDFPLDGRIVDNQYIAAHKLHILLAARIKAAQ